MSRQTAAWLLAGLFIIPLAVVAADTAQRGLESVSFDTAPLREGEAFVYDVTVLSDFSQISTTAERVLEIVVEAPFKRAGDGFIPVTTTRAPASWDIVARPSWEMSKSTKDVRYGETVTEYVTLENGQLVFEERTMNEQHWYAAGGDYYHYAFDLESSGHPKGTAGHALVLADLMDATWSHKVGAFGVDGTPDDDAFDLPLRGSWQERTVYGRVETNLETYHDGAAPFDCSIPTPGIPYSEPQTAEEYLKMELAIEQVITTWYDPDRALPVVVECHATVFKVHPEKDIGHIRVIATMSEHTRGGAAYENMPWDHHTPEPGQGPLTALPAAMRGVPKDTSQPAEELPGSTDSGFRFPLSAAYDVVAAWDDGDWTSFWNEGVVLVGAGYWPGMATHPDCPPTDVPVENCASDLVVPDVVPVPADAAPRTMVSPHWWLTFENEDSGRRIIQVMRDMTTTGETIEDRVVLVSKAGFTGYHVTHEVPEEFVPLQDALDHWLNTAGPTLDVWREQNAAAFYYTLERFSTDGDLRPVYTFRSGEYEEEFAQLANKRDALATFGADRGYEVYYQEQVDVDRYDGTHGAELESGKRSFRIEGAQEPTIHRQTADYSVPLPVDYTPVAAAVVGVVSLGAVAIGAMPNTRGWMRGLVALPLFTKLSRNQVLEHRTRDSMLSYVKANPGVGTEEIRKHLEIGWGTAVYHLSALEQNGLLSSMRQGGNRHWFSGQGGPRMDKEAIALLRSPAARRLHEAIMHAPGRTQQELAGELGVTHGAVIFQVRKLERAGLIRKERDGRFVRYFGRQPDGPALPTVPAS